MCSSLIKPRGDEIFLAGDETDDLGNRHRDGSVGGTSAPLRLRIENGQAVVPLAYSAARASVVALASPLHHLYPWAPPVPVGQTGSVRRLLLKPRRCEADEPTTPTDPPLGAELSPLCRRALIVAIAVFEHRRDSPAVRAVAKLLTESREGGTPADP